MVQLKTCVCITLCVILIIVIVITGANKIYDDRHKWRMCETDQLVNKLAKKTLLRVIDDKYDIRSQFPLSNTTYVITGEGLGKKEVDSWGHPFKLRYSVKVRNEAEKCTIVNVLIYSTGRNGIDENGGGDDVAAQPIFVPLWDDVK